MMNRLFRLSIVLIFLYFLFMFLLKIVFPLVTDSSPFSRIVQILLVVIFQQENLYACIVRMTATFLSYIYDRVWIDPSDRRDVLDARHDHFDPSESLLSEIREVFSSTEVQITEFDWDTIVTGTNNFSDSNIAGAQEGRILDTCKAVYYKAVLQPTSEVVVVKRFSESYGQEVVDEFMCEIRLLPKLEHPNIIKLIGYCIHGKEKLLVYESGPVSGNLDVLLYVSSMFKLQWRSFPFNQWSVRFNMIKGIAEGVAYLHEYSETRVVHGDLKLSNIMLDFEKNPRISGFASARSTTPGNMSAEHNMQMKSDIYKFGVIVLVMMSGMRVTTDLDIASLIDHARMVKRMGAAFGMVEDVMMATCVADEAQRCLQVGLSCTQEDPDSRPAITSVLQILHGDH